jgi:hypothetical protein
MQPVVEYLAWMAGPRERCMYCGDSRAADVEHYFPKSTFPQRAFDWSNMLWVCTPCNRRKSNSFPVKLGVPLLIDPVRRDPWKHLFFDEETGLVTPRPHPSLDIVDPFGKATLSVLEDTLCRESVSEGRRRSGKALRKLAQEQLLKPVSAACFVYEALDVDDYGLLRWYVHFEGNGSDPFCSLRTSQKSVWRVLSCAC